MAKIGERSVLRVLREKPFGCYLDGGETGEILLPRGEMPPGVVVGNDLEVFLYLDSEDRPVATCRMPKVMPGRVGKLKCIQVNAVGAFLDWGLAKDLLVPFREQRRRMELGKHYLVHVHVDAVSGRIAASSNIEKFLSRTPPPFRSGQPVEVMAFERTPLGYKVVVEGNFPGMVFSDGVFQPLAPGELLRGYVVQVRPDGKTDVRLQAPGRNRVEDATALILAELRARGGFWNISDDTSAAEIHSELGVSKRTFKQAVGALLKQRVIELDERGIRLTQA